MGNLDTTCIITKNGMNTLYNSWSDLKKASAPFFVQGRMLLITIQTGTLPSIQTLLMFMWRNFQFGLYVHTMCCEAFQWSVDQHVIWVRVCYNRASNLSRGGQGAVGASLPVANCPCNKTFSNSDWLFKHRLKLSPHFHLHIVQPQSQNPADSYLWPLDKFLRRISKWNRMKQREVGQNMLAQCTGSRSKTKINIGHMF
jgi:hypothetical protein